jgi:hypothetical protein
VVTFLVGSEKVTIWGLSVGLKGKIRVENCFRKVVTFLGKRGPLRFMIFMLLFTIFKTLENFLKTKSNKVTR